MSDHVVRSADGTPIAFRAIGAGPPLVLVHGAGTSSGDWAQVTPPLRERFTVILMDRRGRGRSGDAPEYALERECEDLAAVLGAVGGELVVAHSFGALCAMSAAPRLAGLRGLVLYEPPIALPMAFAARVRVRVEAGEDDAVLASFLRWAGMRDEQISSVRASPAWTVLMRAVPTLPRELEAAARWRPPDPPTAAPTLFLLGGDTTDAVYLEGLDGLVAAHPAARCEVIPGQTHVAHVFDAEAFAARIPF